MRWLSGLSGVVKALLAQGAVADAQLKRDRKPFSRRLEKTLRNLGLELDDRMRDGRTPLHYAAEANAHEAVKLLLAHGADVNRQSLSGWTPLHVAAWKNHTKGVSEKPLSGLWNLWSLIDFSKPETLQTGRDGIFQRFPKVAELLIAGGTDLDINSSFAPTPLHIATRADAREVAKLLILHGADVRTINASRNEPLHVAAQENARKVAELLIVSGAEVNARNGLEETPLDVATERESFAVRDLLLRHGGRRS